MTFHLFSVPYDWLLHGARKVCTRTPAGYVVQAEIYILYMVCSFACYFILTPMATLTVMLFDLQEYDYKFSAKL